MTELELHTEPKVVLERLLKVLEQHQVLTPEELSHIISSQRLPEAERLARLEEVMGKYAEVPTSSEAFMQRKHAELTINPDA